MMFGGDDDSRSRLMGSVILLILFLQTDVSSALNIARHHQQQHRGGSGLGAARISWHSSQLLKGQDCRSSTSLGAMATLEELAARGGAPSFDADVGVVVGQQPSDNNGLFGQPSDNTNNGFGGPPSFGTGTLGQQPAPSQVQNNRPLPALDSIEGEINMNS